MSSRRRRHEHGGLADDLGRTQPVGAGGAACPRGRRPVGVAGGGPQPPVWEAKSALGSRESGDLPGPVSKRSSVKRRSPVPMTWSFTIGTDRSSAETRRPDGGCGGCGGIATLAWLGADAGVQPGDWISVSDMLLPAGQTRQLVEDEGAEALVVAFRRRDGGDERRRRAPGRGDDGSASGTGDASGDSHHATLACPCGRGHRSAAGGAADLNRETPDAFAELHPDDADRLGLAEGDRVEVDFGQERTARLPVRVAATVAPGCVFVPANQPDLAVAALLGPAPALRVKVTAVEEAAA
jgi:hypothetical protein